MDSSSHTYNAFISYSRRDERSAKNIESFLEGYKIPKSFRSGTNSGFKIFRDVYDIEMGELSDQIKRGLDESEFLIVLCSPNSYKSEYVSKEIRIFGEKNGPEKILPILVSGRPNSEVTADDRIQDPAFNEALFDFFNEPLSADIRKLKGESYFKRQTKLREARFQIISKLLHTRKSDELVGRYKWNRRVRLGIPLLLVLAIIAFFGWQYYDNIPKSGIRQNLISKTSGEGQHTRKNLEVLSRALEQEIPGKRDPNSLLVATWNIKELRLHLNDSGRMRTSESFAYIAQILSRFDLVAIQEVRATEEALSPILEYLGKHWKSQSSGISEGRRGNNEMFCFIYDSRKIEFNGYTDKIVIPEGIEDPNGEKVQIAKPPFIAEFAFNGVRIQACNVHFIFGGNDRESHLHKVKELQATIDVLKRRHEREGGEVATILLGDMNIPSLNEITEEEDMIKIIETHNFLLPKPTRGVPSNVSKNQAYDEIALAKYKDSIPFRVLGGGVFDLFQYVYTEEQRSVYHDLMKSHKNDPSTLKTDSNFESYYNRYWKRVQISDHLPKWVQLKTDN